MEVLEQAWGWPSNGTEGIPSCLGIFGVTVDKK
jgi:hypothetical protein